MDTLSYVIDGSDSAAVPVPIIGHNRRIMETPSHGIKPSDSSLAAVRATVEQEMDDCKRRLLSLQADIIALHQEQYALRTKLNAASLFMVKLPLEVISHIFELVNQSQDKRMTRLLPVPFFLGKICKAWRNIVWETPRLWAFITIDLDFRRISTQQKLFQEFLDRSGNSLLHIFITFATEISGLDFIAKLLVKTSLRWKAFTTRPFAALANEIRIHSPRFPNLSFLHIAGQRIYHFNSSKFDFSNAPLLQTLYLSGCDAAQSLTLCWEKLVEVNIDSPFFFNDAIHLINQLKAVEKLQIQIDGVARNDLAVGPPTLPHTLPHLSNLKIVSTGEGICTMLNGVTTPFLAKLEITHTDIHGGQLWLRAIEQLHQRSLSPLFRLSLEDAYVKETDLLSLLRHLSSLRWFSLSTPRKFKLSGETVKNLDIDGYETPAQLFLPNLLEFTYRGSISFPAKALQDMLEHRLDSSHRIKGLKVLQNLNITYRNKTWTANEARVNPNQLQAFYRKLDDIKARGTTLNLIWDEKAEKQDKD